MQRGLVDHRTSLKRVAVFFQCDGQALKPVGPAGIQVSPDADFVKFRLGMSFYWCRCFTHSAPRAFALTWVNLHIVGFILFFDQRILDNVVRRHHYMC